MKKLASLALCFIIAIALAFMGYRAMLVDSFVNVTPAWRYSQFTGSISANPYIRAHVARTGLLALNQSETAYFVAETDDEGKDLIASCQYILKGKAMAANWWSITAYASDNFLIPNADKIYSYNSKQFGEAFSINIAREKQSENWLPTPQSGSFNLLLRLYEPKSEPRTMSLPNLTKGVCS